MYSNTRRTYKSKKDTVGALDPKDVLLCMDKKSTVFDAFYIQNIKQTKRDLSYGSSANQYSTATNKVRKRKFVKRVIKEVELVSQESSSKSTCLTPDKSIRVNKVLDPFDMLLNSSPVCQEESCKVENKIFRTEMKSKQYKRKKPKKVKTKYNYSSSDLSGSEKENVEKAQNTTDIKSHELLIECYPNTPKIVNESINNIMKNLSMLNQKSLSPVFKTPIKFKRNRLTNNITSPLVKTSPFCSTPCREKYRGQSIYKFSPIISRLNSPDVSVVNTKDSYKTIIENEIQNNVNSTPVPVIEANKSVRFDRDTEIIGINKFQNHDTIINSFQEHGSRNLTQNICEKDEVVNESISYTENVNKTDHSHSKVIQSTDINNTQNNNVHQSKIVSLDNTEPDLFLGFSNIANKDKTIDEVHVIENMKKIFKKLVNDSESNNSASSIVEDKTDNSLEHVVENETDIENKTIEINVKCTDYSKDNNEMLTDDSLSSSSMSSYDTCNGDFNDHMNKDPIVFIEKLSDSVVYKYYEKMLNNDISSNSNNLNGSSCYGRCESKATYYDSELSNSDTESNTSLNNSNENLNSLKQVDELQCTSGNEINSSVESKITHFNINCDNSNTCENNVSKCIQDINSSQEINMPLSNYVNNSNESDCTSSESYTEFSDCDSTTKISQSQNSNNNDESYIQSECSSSDENQHVSYVTTRRRNKGNNSLYMSIYSKSVDTSPLSISTDCEKTVLSNKISLDKTAQSDITLSRSLNSANNEEDTTHVKLKGNAKKQVRRSSIKARNLRTSRHSTVITNVESEDSSDKSNDEIEDSSNVTLYKININKTVNNNISQDQKEDEICSNSETPLTSDSINTEIQTIKDASDSDVITVTDSDDINAFKTKDMSKNDKTNSSDYSSNNSESNNKLTEMKRNSNKYNYRKSTITTRKSLKLLRDSNRMLNPKRFTFIESEPVQGIVLQPGKKWERSLSIYRRMSMMGDFDVSILDEDIEKKGRKYRESVINTMEMQDCRGSLLHNESIHSRRSSIQYKPHRSTISIVKDPDNSRLSLSSTSVTEDLQENLVTAIIRNGIIAFSTPLFFDKALEAKCMHLSLQYTGFLNDECDDTIIELSKLSLADADHEVTVLGLHEKPERGSTARDYVLRRCQQTDTILFDECYPDTVLKNCHKIGEGVYGEVFLWRDRDGRARVMKIVPVAGAIKVNGEDQKDFQEIISEIVIAMELSALRSPIAAIDRHFEDGKDVDTLDLHDLENATDVFNEVLAVRCVYGSYPSRLLDLWDLYDESKGSENDNPAILPVDQQYIVLELANAGQDLESYQFNNAEQAHALFLQVAFGLAVGEESYQFEHRDLHWGNVLIAPTDQKYASFVLRGRCHRVARCGVAATIIDYSLSRLSFPLGAGVERAALYNDLSADDGLFDAVGDYQFEVYRLMRDKLGNDWKNFEPYTNILWLHYTVDKMITALRYKRVNTKIHKHYIDKLKGIKNRLLTYGSAVQFVLTDNEF